MLPTMNPADRPELLVVAIMTPYNHPSTLAAACSISQPTVQSLKTTSQIPLKPYGTPPPLSEMLPGSQEQPTFPGQRDSSQTSSSENSCGSLTSGVFSLLRRPGLIDPRVLRGGFVLWALVRGFGVDVSPAAEVSSVALAFGGKALLRISK